MTDDTLITVTEDLTSANLEGETVLLDVNTGSYYSLNTVGARILELAQNPVTVQNLKQALLQTYLVEPERLDVDLQTFLKALAHHHLIRVHEPQGCLQP